MYCMKCNAFRNSEEDRFNCLQDTRHQAELLTPVPLKKILASPRCEELDKFAFTRYGMQKVKQIDVDEYRITLEGLLGEMQIFPEYPLFIRFKEGVEL